MDNVELGIWALRFTVTPFLSLLGIFGNTISIAILAKAGLKKTSEILIFSLAVADLTFLIGVNNFPNYMYSEDKKRGVEISNLVSTARLVLAWIDDVGVYCSIFLPVLITLDRILAIFFPFSYHRLVSPCRIWIAISLLFLFYSSVLTYLTIMDVRGIPQDVMAGGNGSFRFENLKKDPTIEVNLSGHWILVFFINHLSGTLPVALVVVGTTVLGIKIRMASIQRGKLTTGVKKRAIASKATRTLLSVCVVYSIITGFVCLNDQFNHDSSTRGKILQEMNSPLLCVNSLCNFLIYVVTNKKFRVSTLWKAGTSSFFTKSSDSSTANTNL